MGKAYRKEPQQKCPKEYIRLYDEINAIVADRERREPTRKKMTFEAFSEEAEKLGYEHARIFGKICEVFELTDAQRSELLGIKQQIETSHSTYDYHLEEIKLPVQRKNKNSPSMVKVSASDALNEMIEHLERVTEMMENNKLLYEYILPADYEKEVARLRRKGIRDGTELDNTARSQSLANIEEYELRIGDLHEVLKNARKKITVGRKKTQYGWFDYGVRLIAEFWRHSLNKKYIVQANDQSPSAAYIFTYAVCYTAMPNDMRHFNLVSSMRKAKALLENEPVISFSAQLKNLRSIKKTRP